MNTRSRAEKPVSREYFLDWTERKFIMRSFLNEIPLIVFYNNWTWDILTRVGSALSRTLVAKFVYWSNKAISALIVSTIHIYIKNKIFTYNNRKVITSSCLHNAGKTCFLASIWKYQCSNSDTFHPKIYSTNDSLSQKMNSQAPLRQLVGYATKICALSYSCCSHHWQTLVAKFV
jgi:hypothetical protein